MAKKSVKSSKKHIEEHVHEEAPSKEQTSMTKFLVLGALIFLLLFVLFKKNPGLTPTTQKDIVQSSAQLAKPDGKFNGFGTTIKSYDGTTFEVNVSAFVGSPAKGKDYYVYLKGGSPDARDIQLGKMALSGDVYSLNYMSEEDLYSYTDLVVVESSEEEAAGGKMDKVVLVGKFPN